MANNSRIMDNLIHSCQGRFANVIQENLFRTEAYHCELQKNQTTSQDNEVLRNREGQMIQEISRLRDSHASLQKHVVESNAMNEGLQSQIMDLKSSLDAEQCVCSKIPVRTPCMEPANQEPRAVYK
jgi:hypothetical protein